MILSQPDIDRIGIDAFVGNMFVNIQEDLNGKRSASQISDYYFNNYGIDVTFTEKSVNVRLYTETEGWSQSSNEVFFK
jgi:hypothetical protein